MSENSKIEWTDHTFNPWIGCTKVSPGCANCYAETLMDTRYGRVKWGKGNPRQRTKTWGEPLKWNKNTLFCPCCKQWWASGAQCMNCNVTLEKRRPRVFCASLADWLDDEVPIEWLADLLKRIHETQHLDWLLLTKRPENWRKRLTKILYPDGDFYLTPIETLTWMMAWLRGTAPTNVWIGTTVEDQTRADERIPHLLDIPAKVRFLSCEPLLGPVDLQSARTKCCPNGGCFFDDRYGKRLVADSTEGGILIECACSRLGDIHWVICGGESGPNARPMHPDWARSLRDQCHAAGVPFFFKQWGEWGASCYHGFANKEAVGRAETTLPGPYSFYRVGKKAAGRLLDGVEWNQFPGDSTCVEPVEPSETSAIEKGCEVQPGGEL